MVCVLVSFQFFVIISNEHTQGVEKSAFSMETFALEDQYWYTQLPRTEWLQSCFAVTIYIYIYIYIYICTYIVWLWNEYFGTQVLFFLALYVFSIHVYCWPESRECWYYLLIDIYIYIYIHIYTYIYIYTHIYIYAYAHTRYTCRAGKKDLLDKQNIYVTTVGILAIINRTYMSRQLAYW